MTEEQRCEDYDVRPGVHYHAYDLPPCRNPAAYRASNGRWLCATHMTLWQTQARLLQISTLAVGEVRR
jgi:hypothetical protein